MNADVRDIRPGARRYARDAAYTPAPRTKLTARGQGLVGLCLAILVVLALYAAWGIGQQARCGRVVMAPRTSLTALQQACGVAVDTR